jgi:hypothetical protein
MAEATAKEAQILEGLEDKVDQELSDRFQGTGSVSISTSVFKGLRTCTTERFLDKYRKADWSVKIVYDQRDGDFYSFGYNPTPQTKDYDPALDMRGR